MPEQYDKSQGQSPTNRAYLAAADVVDKELSRAGISLPDERRAGIIEGLVGAAQGVPIEPGSDAAQFRALVEMGQAIGQRPSLEELQKAGITDLFPITAPNYLGDPLVREQSISPSQRYSVEAMHAKQRQGFGGYGWTQEKIDKLGRMPNARELSEDGRAAWEWKRRKDFLDSLVATGDSAESGVQSAEKAMALSGGVGAAMSPPDKEAIRRSLLDKAIGEYEQQRGRTHGESGYVGALQNPEYLAGYVVSGMNALPEAAWRQYLDSSHGEIDKGRGAVLSALPALGSEHGGMAHAGMAASDLFTKHLPDALDHASVQAAARRVEPLVMRGQTPEQSAKALNEVSNATPLTYDEHYYKQHGTYPSYLHSSAATFLNGLLDPSVLATGPAARVASLTGKGLRMAGVASRGSWIRPLLSAYGRSVYRDAAPLAKYPILAAARKETIEELPTNAGLMGLFGVAPKLSQPEDEAMRTESPLPTDWFSSGVNARKDLWKQDQETGKWHPPSDEEIRAGIAKREAAAANAPLRGMSYVNQLPTGPSKQTNAR